MSTPPVFATDEFAARPATRAETADIEAFNEANAGYWLLTHGHPPTPDDAERAFDQHPPPEMSYSEDLWFLLRDTGEGRIIGQIACATDLLAAGVYHLGFFIVATELQGSGFARRAHRAWEAWAIRRGARWLRLGVVETNSRARAFWGNLGYVEMCRRSGYLLGERSHVLITMAKPLGDNTLAQCLAAVPRDRVVP